MKDNRMPEYWDENLNRLQQRVLDARWVKKNGINHHVYKNNICIDVEHGFIKRYAVTPTNIHNSRMMTLPLDPENTDDYAWADSAYAGERFEDLLNLGGFESCIHEKGSRNHSASDAHKERNRIKSGIRACVKHIFGCMTMSMCGKMTRKNGHERNKAW